MCDLHELLVGEPKGVLEGGVFSCTKDDLEGTGMKQSRRLDGLQTKSSLRLDFSTRGALYIQEEVIAKLSIGRG